MFRALLYLRLTSLANRLLVAGRRLRRPKYLAGAIVGVAYFYFLVFRRIGGGYAPRDAAGAGVPAAALAGSLRELGAALIFLLAFSRQAWAWAARPKPVGLRFTEAEIAFLFPAPLTRRRLVHFSLLNSQLLILLSSLALSLFFNRGQGLGGNPLTHAVGWWVILSTLRLHSTAAGLTAARVLQQRADFPAIRRRVLGGLALLAAFVFTLIRRQAGLTAPAELASGLGLLAYLHGLLGSGAVHGLLWPFTWVVAPFLAPDGRSFGLSLGPALLLLAALYSWVVRLEVSFEDDAIATAERQTQTRAARQAGGRFAPAPGSAKAGREPFHLDRWAWPEAAFLWKNLIAIQSWFNARAFVMLLAVGAVLASTNHGFAASFGPGAGIAPLVLLGAGLGAVYLLVAGPQWLRQDLRHDLAYVDLLKAYPLPGWRVLLGELLMPVGILSGLLWLALLAIVWALGRLGYGDEALGPGAGLVLPLCAGLIVPPVCLLQLLVPNGAALLFPNWFQATRNRTGGIELMGHRLIFAFGQFIAVVLALLPAALLGALLLFASQWLIGLAAGAVLATGAILVVIGGEIWLGLWWLGRCFERFDLAAEPRM